MKILMKCRSIQIGRRATKSLRLIVHSQNIFRIIYHSNRLILIIHHPIMRTSVNWRILMLESVILKLVGNRIHLFFS